MKISSQVALQQLQNNTKLQSLFEHGSLEVSIYRPTERDKQEPHTRDGIYVVMSGTGEFIDKDKKMPFQPLDVIFVPAGTEHRFINFTEDFTTWLLFIEPQEFED